MATTTYKPLQDTDEIRLLFLEPGEDLDFIKCSISHTKLSSKLKYEALSYMWGDPGRLSANIILDGQHFHIRENLFSALNHLRQRTAVRALWIDALCINQQDVNERNHQVNQMGKIYSQAQMVVAWLGPPNAYCSSAMQDISTGLALPNLPWREWDNEIKVKLEKAKILCSQEYWGRLWIIQELVLATDILIQCGRDTVKWNSMCKFFMQIEKSARARSALTTADNIRASIPARIFRQWRDRQDAMSQNQLVDRNLHDLCLRYVEAKCEDQRDKVFGLLGFAETCCREAVPVDYSLSLYKICGRVLHHHFLTHVYDEGEKPTTKRPSGSHFDGRIPGLVILTSQIFHHALGITARQYVPLVNGNHFAISVETPDIVVERIPKQMLPVVQNIDRRKRTSWQKLLETPRQFRDLKPRLPVRTKKAPRMVNTTTVITSDTLVQVAGNIRGRIAWLSPPLTDEVDYPSFESGIEASFEVEDNFIIQELERIEQYLLGLSRMTFCQEPQLSIPALPSDVDLVCSILSARSTTSFCIFPVDFELPSTKVKNSWSQDESSVANKFYGIWTRIQNAMPENYPKSHRIAIEEFGLICIVPVETQASDLICLFPQSDVVAIVRHTDEISPIVGRAVSFLAHNSSTPLRTLDGWPELCPVTDSKVCLELDAEILQMLTRASCNVVNHV